MTSQPDKIRRQKCIDLLRSVNRAAPVENAADAQEYDWTKPHYWNTTRRNRLNNFCKKFTGVAAAKLADVFNQPIEIKFCEISELFDIDVPGMLGNSEPGQYVVGFQSVPESPDTFSMYQGALVISSDTTTDWITKLLGDADPQKDNTELSGLEESLLMDIVLALTNAAGQAAQIQFTVNPTIFHGVLPFDYESGCEFCKMDFTSHLANNEKDSPFSIIVGSASLDRMINPNDHQSAGAAEETVKNTMLENIKAATVSIQTQLANVHLTLEELMSLEPGDILLLSKNTHEPINATVEGRPFFKGYPVKADDRHAILITEHLINAK